MADSLALHHPIHRLGSQIGQRCAKSPKISTWRTRGRKGPLFPWIGCLTNPCVRHRTCPTSISNSRWLHRSLAGRRRFPWCLTVFRRAPDALIETHRFGLRCLKSLFSYARGDFDSECGVWHFLPGLLRFSTQEPQYMSFYAYDSLWRIICFSRDAVGESQT